MPALNSTNFPQFFAAQRAQILSAKDMIRNMSQQTSYPLGIMLRKASESDLARRDGGTHFSEVLGVPQNVVNAAYNPGDPASVNISGSAPTLMFPHSFYRTHVGWTEVERLLKTAGGDFTASKDFTGLKAQDGYTKHVNSLNAILFKRPDSALMEAATIAAPAARLAYSIPAFISEDPFRFAPPIAQWTGAAAATTIGGLNPTSNTWWRNARRTYTPGKLDHPTEGIVAAFDRIKLDLVYTPMPDAGKKMQTTKMGDIVCFTNGNGHAILEGLYRSGNFAGFSKPNDPALGELMYGNIPIIHAPQLDTELLDQTVAAADASVYTGQPYPDGFPRFFFVNVKTLKMVFQAGAMADEQKPVVISGNQPDTMVVWTNSIPQIVCNDRRTQGIVCPA